MLANPFRPAAALGFRSVLGQNPWHLFRIQVVMKVVVHLDRRSPAADPDALNFFKRENSILRHALVPYSQFLLESLV